MKKDTHMKYVKASVNMFIVIGVFIACLLILSYVSILQMRRIGLSQLNVSGSKVVVAKE
jgi:hypothetical protein